jgi:hypothetical protein
MDLDTLFAGHKDRFEDFWGRRQNKPKFVREVALWGWPLHLSSNDEHVLSAIDFCLPQYTVAPVTARKPFTIQMVVETRPDGARLADPGPAPEELLDYTHYTGDAAWLSIQLGRWGHCHVDLDLGRAIAVLTPRLASRPDLLSRCLLNTVITNFFIGSGFAMLHASCLYHDGRALLLMAVHNSGKSTTALRLALAGYPLVSDSMIFLPPRGAAACHGGAAGALLGFPVGTIKLRPDTLPWFPEATPFVTTEKVRGETKYRVDLGKLNPALVYEKMACPKSIDLCLLRRGVSDGTSIQPAQKDEVERAIMENSLFYDTATIWQRNLGLISKLLTRARWHHLVVGRDPAQILTAVDGLWST